MARQMKIKCYGCKVHSHTQPVCENDLKNKKEKSVLGVNENESESEREE